MSGDVSFDRNILKDRLLAHVFVESENQLSARAGGTVGEAHAGLDPCEIGSGEQAIHNAIQQGTLCTGKEINWRRKAKVASRSFVRHPFFTPPSKKGGGARGPGNSMLDHLSRTKSIPKARIVCLNAAVRIIRQQSPDEIQQSGQSCFRPAAAPVIVEARHDLRIDCSGLIPGSLARVPSGQECIPPGSSVGSAILSRPPTEPGRPERELQNGGDRQIGLRSSSNSRWHKLSVSHHGVKHCGAISQRTRLRNRAFPKN